VLILNAMMLNKYLTIYLPYARSEDLATPKRFAMAQMDGNIERTARNGQELEFRVEKLARPNPLGLFAFATTTLVLGLYTCNTRYSLV
jgi:hypothetical protein